VTDEIIEIYTEDTRRERRVKVHLARGGVTTAPRLSRWLRG
jgi:hypothetical protein